MNREPEQNKEIKIPALADWGKLYTAWEKNGRDGLVKALEEIQTKKE